MRSVFVARRGFNGYPLDSDNMLSLREFDDFGFVASYLKKTYDANVYILGVSLGGSIVAQRLA